MLACAFHWSFAPHAALAASCSGNELGLCDRGYVIDGAAALFHCRRKVFMKAGGD